MNNSFNSFISKFPSVCHFDNKIAGPHYYVLLPLGNEVIITLLITSQIGNHIRHSKTINKEEGIYINNSYKGFDCLNKDSVIVCYRITIYTLETILNMPKFNCLSYDLDKEVIKTLILKIYQSDDTKRSIKKAIKTHYEWCFV
jgi:hypothetical protein